jgi:hypothetical protein
LPKPDARTVRNRDPTDLAAKPATRRHHASRVLMASCFSRLLRFGSAFGSVMTVSMRPEGRAIRRRKAIHLCALGATRNPLACFDWSTGQCALSAETPFRAALRPSPAFLDLEQSHQLKFRGQDHRARNPRDCRIRAASQCVVVCAAISSTRVRLKG